MNKARRRDGLLLPPNAIICDALFMLGRDMFIVIRPSYEIASQIHNLAAKFAVFGSVAEVAHIIEGAFAQTDQSCCFHRRQKVWCVIQSQRISLHQRSPQTYVEPMQLLLADSATLNSLWKDLQGQVERPARFSIGLLHKADERQ